MEQSGGTCQAGQLLADVQVAPLLLGGGVGPFSPAGSLPEGRYGIATGSVVYNGFLYIAGGRTAGGFSRDVLVAPLTSDGGVGPWVAASSLPDVHYEDALVAYNGHLYAFGDAPNSQIAAIHSDGSLSPWANGPALTVPRTALAGVAYNGWLYAVGGYTGGEEVDLVDAAPLRPDGSLGAFRAATPMLAARCCRPAFAFGGHLYALGSAPDSAEVAPIYADGSLGGWMALGSLTPLRQAAAIHQGTLYVTGGLNPSPALATTLVSSIAGSAPPAGDVGGWQTAGTFPTARQHLAAAVSRGHLYLIGGCTSGSLQTSCTTFAGDVQIARLNEDGTVGPAWTSSPQVFATARDSAAAVVHGEFLYVSGGRSPAGLLGDTQFARVNADGSLGPFLTAAATFTPRRQFVLLAHRGFLYAAGGNTPVLDEVLRSQIDPATGEPGPWSLAGTLGRRRTESTGAIYDDHLYVIGGFDGVGLADLESAPIAADGSLGAFTPFALPTDRAVHGSVAADGFLYLFGGNNSLGSRSVEVAPIQAGGAVGPWTALAALPVARIRHATVEHAGKVYLIGGNDEVAYRDDVQVATLRAPAATGSYSRLVDLTGASEVGCLTVRGASGRSGHVWLSYRFAGDGAQQPFSEPVDLGIVPINTGVPVSIANARYLFLRAVLDDRQAAVRPYTAASARDVSALEIAYAGEACGGLPQADGGSGPPLRLVVACGCDGMADVPAFALLLLALPTLRRRARAPSQLSTFSSALKRAIGVR